MELNRLEPLDMARGMFRKILVAVDGSEPSNRALKYAAELALRFGAELKVLVVVPKVMLPAFPNEGIGTVPAALYSEVDRYQERARAAYQKVLEDSIRVVRETHPEVRVEGVLREGRPSSTIVEMADKEGVDLIVMGSRGLGGIMGWVLGSTSRRVVDSCTKPILVVK
jgi:nucleotide-binding universal stress UspA family protein